MFETFIVETMAAVLAPAKRCRIIAQAMTRACMYLSWGMTVRSEWTYFLRSTWLTSLIYCLTQPCGTCWEQFAIGLNLYSIFSENPSLSHHNINTSAGRIEKQRLWAKPLRRSWFGKALSHSRNERATPFDITFKNSVCDSMFSEVYRCAIWSQVSLSCYPSLKSIVLLEL